MHGDEFESSASSINNGIAETGEGGFSQVNSGGHINASRDENAAISNS